MWVDVPPDYRVMAKSGANPIAPEEVLEQIRLLTQP
jgi:hypothetical protein